MAKQKNHSLDKDKLGDTEQQLKAINQQLRASEQQLKAANQQLEAGLQQLRASEKQLREEQQKAQKYLDVAGAMIIAITADQLVVLVNKKGYEVLGYEENEILGRNWFDNFLPRRAREKAKAVFQQLMEGKVKQVEYYDSLILTKSGEERIVTWHNAVLMDEDANIVEALFSGIDITERKKAEQVLAEEHNLLRTLIDNLPDSVYIKDIKGRFVIGNIEVARRAGVATPDELTGKTDFDFYPQKLASRYYADEQKIIRSGQPLINREERVINQTTGETIWNLTTKILWQDNYGKTIGIIGIGRNITGRKKAEQALRDSEALYVSLVENLRQYIFRKDLEGRFTFGNKRFCEALGRPLDEIIGKTDFDFYPADLAEKYLRDDQNVIETGEVFDTVEEHQLSDGKKIYVQVVKTPLYDSAGEVVGTQGIFWDITERKKAEQDLKAANQQLRASEQQLKAANQQLQASEQQLKAANQQLQASEQQLKAANQQLRASEQQLKAANQQLQATNQQLRASQEEIRALAKFPSEDPYPVLRIAKDGTVIYSNDAGLALLTAWGTEVGRRLPDKWRKFITDVLKTGSGKDTEFEYDSRILSLRFAPVVDENYVNIYGLDITRRKKAEEKLFDYQAQLKSLASQLTLVEESERHRIATELHATIGQSLVVSKMKLDELRASTPSKELAQTLGEACDLLGQTIQETRTLTFDLSSPILYELGFEKAVAEWLSEQIRGKHGIATEFEDDGQPKPLDDDIRIFLFRDVRELLINAVKHAQAKKVKVSIRKVKDQIQVSVEDDGCGFEPNKVTAKAVSTGAFGLFSIRQRLEELGGHFEVKSAPGQGCRITMTAPLKTRKD